MEYIEFELNKVNIQKSMLIDIVSNSVLDVTGDVRKLIKKRWLRGESVNGGKILNRSNGLGYASFTYRNLKLLKNPGADGYVDLTLTGSLGDNIYIKFISDGEHEILSSDSKYNEIGNKYGFDEFGLNNDEYDFILKLIADKINNSINNLNL